MTIIAAESPTDPTVPAWFNPEVAEKLAESRPTAEELVGLIDEVAGTIARAIHIEQLIEDHRRNVLGGGDQLEGVAGLSAALTGYEQLSDRFYELAALVGTHDNVLRNEKNERAVQPFADRAGMSVRDYLDVPDARCDRAMDRWGGRLPAEGF